MIRPIAVGTGIGLAIFLTVAAMLAKGCPLVDFVFERDTLFYF